MKVPVVFGLTASLFNSWLCSQHLVSKMTPVIKSCFVILAVLFVWRVDEGAEACKCIPVHPQQGFCKSDVVIRAKVTKRHEIDHDGIKSVKYSIKETKVFKGPSRDIDALYTSQSSAACGANLLTGKQYLITGRLDNGKVQISSCNFIERWDALSDDLKLSLTRHYGNGCGCEITYCSSVPCVSSSPAECFWDANDEKLKNDACIKRSDGSCFWHKGSAPPSQTS